MRQQLRRTSHRIAQGKERRARKWDRFAFGARRLWHVPVCSGQVGPGWGMRVGGHGTLAT
eukprot:1611781-Rhodomonas_salina.1